MPLLLALACATDPQVETVAGEGLAFCLGDDTVLVQATHPMLAPLAVGLLDEPSLASPTLRLRHSGGVCDGCRGTGDARSVPLNRLSWLGPETIEISLDAGQALEPGVWDLEITSPEGEEGLVSGLFLVLPQPDTEGPTPSSVCYQADTQELTFAGEGLLSWNDTLPIAELVTGEQAISALEDCEPLALDHPGQVCETALLDVAPSAMAIGHQSVFLWNPAPADCEGSTPVELEIVSAPTVDEVSPEAVCTGGGTVTLTGRGLVEGTQVFAGEQELDTTWISEAAVEVDTTPLAVGSYDLSVVIPGGCGAELSSALQVSETPLVFYVDPPVIHPNVETTLTAYVADLSGEVQEAWITDSAGVRTEVEWRWDASDAGRLYFTPPAYMANGEYSLHLVQDGSCEGEFTGSFRMRRYSPIELDRLDPAFAWTFSRSPVEIYALESGEPFQATPRVYLMGPDREAGTYPLLGVRMEDDFLLRATVPESLPVGTYSLLVLNPDESMGLMEDALEVSGQAPPTIEAVTPSSLDKSNPELVEILGRDFRDATVTLSCDDGSGPEEVSTTVVSETYGLLEIQVPSTGYNGAVCTVQVVNADGSAAVFSAISVRNPSQNLFPWSAGPDMVEARRSPATDAARLDSVTRYLLAAGGDGGDTSTAMDSIEVADIGVYGELGTWTLLDQTLPGPRSGATLISLHPYVYVIGGHDGTSATDTLYRAEVLDPNDAPLIESVNMARKSTGLEPGTWRYRVSAVFPAYDYSNPKGEGLPSEPLILVLPEVSGGVLRPTLNWTSVDGAVRYRVYRSPSADAAQGSEELVAEVSTTSFTDTGLGTDPSVLPLVPGSLGEWKELNSLKTARAFHCSTLAYDPETDPENAYLYVGGGLDVDDNPLDSVEYLKVRIEGPKTQTTGAWKVSANTLDTARYGCAAYTIDAENHSVVELDESWVVFAGGMTKTKATGEAQAGLVGNGGELDDWQSIQSISPARAGMGSASANDSLYAFGGQKGEPNGTSTSAALTVAPDLANWNSLSTSLLRPRVWVGSAQESAVILIVGGETNDEAATRSTEWTNY